MMIILFFKKKTRLTNDYQWRTLHGVLFAHQLLHVDLNRIRAAACQMLRFRAGRTTRSRIWSTVRACELRRCGKHAVYVRLLPALDQPAHLWSRTTLFTMRPLFFLPFQLATSSFGSRSLFGSTKCPFGFDKYKSLPNLPFSNMPLLVMQFPA
jgi:hypothetical protein